MATTLILDDAGIPRRQGGAIARVGQRTARIILSAAFIVIVLIAWQVVTARGLEPPTIPPSPAAVIAALGGIFSSPDVWADFAASGAELFYGFALAALVGITAGLVFGWYPRVGYFFDPFLNLLYAIPRVA